MLTSDFFDLWYKHFAKGVDQDFMTTHVKGRGCYPWHIFSFERVNCFEGEEALNKFLEIYKYTDVYFYSGYDFENDLVEKGKGKAEMTAFMQTGKETYITERNFKWTFVWTHEGYLCGPYLCFNENKSDIKNPIKNKREK